MTSSVFTDYKVHIVKSSKKITKVNPQDDIISLEKMTNKEIFFILNVSLFLILFSLLIGGYLLYRILFYSAKYQHESAIGVHMSPPS